MSGKPDKFTEAITFLMNRKAIIQQTADELVDESIKYRELIEKFRDLQLENKKLKKEIALLKKRIGAK